MLHKIFVAIVGLCLAGCAGSYVPPVSISGGFFGATVTVSEPGFTVPAKVVSAPVSTPTLVVPKGEPVTSGNIPVTTASGATASVPVKTANVTAPILEVPAETPTSQ